MKSNERKEEHKQCSVEWHEQAATGEKQVNRSEHQQGKERIRPVKKEKKMGLGKKGRGSGIEPGKKRRKQ